VTLAGLDIERPGVQADDELLLNQILQIPASPERAGNWSSATSGRSRFCSEICCLQDVQSSLRDFLTGL
jgi:hypothetical protein